MVICVYSVLVLLDSRMPSCKTTAHSVQMERLKAMCTRFFANQLQPVTLTRSTTSTPALRQLLLGADLTTAILSKAQELDSAIQESAIDENIALGGVWKV